MLFMLHEEFCRVLELIAVVVRLELGLVGFPMHYWAWRIHQRRFGLKRLQTWMKWACEDGSWIVNLGLEHPYLKLKDDWLI